MDITPFLKFMVEQQASDLFFSVGAPPYIKIQGMSKPLNQQKMTSTEMKDIIQKILEKKQFDEFEANLELNIALSVVGVGRFRVNVFRQRGEIALVIRYIKGEIPTVADLNLPDLLNTLIMEMRGLILIVGATGSGKSSALAAMINHRNKNHMGHILTIEDPIEYLYRHEQSIVDQREIGIDTLNYDNALRNAMREAPDVILIGEILEKSTMKHAIAYAQTGHLCLSTLHANNANQAMERVVNFFQEDIKHQLLADLALNLKAVISLRLIPSLQGGRIPAVEVLLNTPYVSELIQKGKIEEIKDAMSRGRQQGMQTFDQSLIDLYFAGKISKEDAIHFADSKNNVSLKLRLTETDVIEPPLDMNIERDEF